MIFTNTISLEEYRMKNTQPKILITGHTGFIGSHLFNKLKDLYDIVGISRGNYDSYMVFKENPENWYSNLEDPEKVECLFDYYQPNIIFHLAGNALVKEGADKLIDSNVKVTHNLLMYAPEGCKFVFASSATVYGDLGQRHSCIETDKTRPTSVYGASKLCAETLIKTYSRIKDINYVILRYVANVGPNSTHGVVHDFIEKLRSDSESLEILGDYPGSEKPYFYVGDTVDATIKFGLDNEIKNQTIDISNSDFLSIDKLADIVMDELNIHKPKKWLGAKANWKGDNPKIHVKADKMKRKGYEPKYNTSEKAVRQAIREISK